MENLLNDLKELQKYIKENNFKQIGQDDDSGKYEQGFFVSSKPIERRVNKMINKILKKQATEI